MKTTITSKGQITIPITIRKKLGLKIGQMLEFDENCSFLKAVPVFDETEMRSVIGSATCRIGCPSRQWLDETRGPVELPESK